MGLATSVKCMEHTGIKEDPIEEIRAARDIVKQKINSPAGGADSLTPYGAGKVIEDNGAMQTVVLAFGTGYMKKELVTNPNTWAAERKIIQDQHRADLAKLEALLAAAQQEKALLAAEAEKARTTLAQQLEATASSEKNMKTMKEADAGKEAGADAADDDVEDLPKVEDGKHDGGMVEESKYDDLVGSKHAHAAPHMGESVQQLCQWTGTNDDVTKKFAGLSAYRISLVSCSTRSKQMKKQGSGIFSSFSSLPAISEVKGDESESVLERVSTEQFKDEPWMAGKYLIATVADEMGRILGASAQTETGKLLEPLYIIGGDVERPRYLFLQLKRIKNKTSMGFKFSEIGYAYMDLADKAFNSGEHQLKMYKKPVDFTRDPSKLKAYGWMRVEVSLVKSGEAMLPAE